MHRSNFIILIPLSTVVLPIITLSALTHSLAEQEQTLQLQEQRWGLEEEKNRRKYIENTENSRISLSWSGIFFHF